MEVKAQLLAHFLFYFLSYQNLFICLQLDLDCITSLKELPESLATAILDQVSPAGCILLFQFFPIQAVSFVILSGCAWQFMISGADKRDKRAYFISLLSKVLFYLPHDHIASNSFPLNPSLFNCSNCIAIFLLQQVDRFARGSSLYQPQKSIDYLPQDSELTSLPVPVLLEEIDHPSPR